MVKCVSRVMRHDPVIPLIKAKQRYEAVLASPKAPDRKRVAALFKIGWLERQLLRRRARTPEGALVSLELLLQELDDESSDVERQLARVLIANALPPIQRQCDQRQRKSR